MRQFGTCHAHVSIPSNLFLRALLLAFQKFRRPGANIQPSLDLTVRWAKPTFLQQLSDLGKTCIESGFVCLEHLLTGHEIAVAGICLKQHDGGCAGCRNSLNPCFLSECALSRVSCFSCERASASTWNAALIACMAAAKSARSMRSLAF